MEINHTKTFYNAITNEIITSESNFSHREGFECIGCKKIAEAMTTVTKEERPIIYNSITYGIIDFDKLNSKLKHKMKKIGLKYYNISNYEPKGYTLLKTIKKKKSGSISKSKRSY